MYIDEQKPRFRSMIGLIVAAFIVAGCSSTGTQEPTPPPEPVDEAPVVQEPIQEVESGPQDFNDRGDPIDASGNPLSRTFYFDYDKSVLRAADLAALELHAQILRRNSDHSVLIEGHCDERGTREYNLALGERRSDAIRTFLISAGVSSRRIESVSYGEEQPDDPGHNESAWARNRRAVVSYR